MTADQLLRLAVILHECYRSYDLVLYLLLAHDRAAGTAYGDAYLKAVSGTHGNKPSTL